MNSKKMIKRMLPVGIAILAVLVIALIFVAIPNRVNRASLSSKYSGKNYFELSEVKLSNDDVYELLVHGFSDQAVADISDKYLVQNIKSVSDQTKSYYDLAKADTEGVDKLISDEIFPKGRSVDALKDDATLDERTEAESADTKAINDWYNSVMSAYNISSLEEIRDIYTVKLAKKLYTIDSIVDEHVFEFALEDIDLIDEFRYSAIDYLKTKTQDTNFVEVERGLYEVVDDAKEAICNLVHAEFETAKFKPTERKGKFTIIDTNSIAQIDQLSRETSDWNKIEDVTLVENAFNTFLDNLVTYINANGGFFADRAALVASTSFPNITDSNKTTYEAAFTDTYYVINVAFKTQKQRDNALAQLDLALIDYKLVHYAKYYEEYNRIAETEEAKAKSDSEKATYCKTEALKVDGVLLTRDEVLQAYVDIYNNYNSTFALNGEDVVLDKLAIDDISKIEQLITWLKNGFTSEVVNDGSNFDLEWLLDESKPEFYAHKDLYDFLDQFRFTAAELTKIGTTFNTMNVSGLKSGLAYYDLLQEKAAAGGEEVKTIDLDSIYGPTTSSNALYFSIKLGFNKGTAYGHSWNDLTAEEKEAKNLEYLMNEITGHYTATVEKNVFAALRKAHDLVIYDDAVEEQYMESYDANLKQTKKGNKSVVFTIDGNEYTADDIYEYLAGLHGVTSIIALYEQDYFINSPFSRLDEVYKNGKWLTKTDAYEEVISSRLENATETYDYYNYYYASYGYPTMTWEEFLESVYFYYGVKTTDDLKMFFVYQDAEESYKNTYVKLGEFKDGAFNYANQLKYNNNYMHDAEGTKTLWDCLYSSTAEGTLNLFDEIDVEYFGITGFHMLVSLNDGNGGKIAADKWSDVQTKFGQEFYNYLRNKTSDWEPAKWETEWKALADDYNNNTPVYNIKDLAANTSVTTGKVLKGAPNEVVHLVEDDYKLAIYKTLGFELTCENLSSITSSSASNYDKGFIDGIKQVYANIVNVDGVPTAQSDLHALNEGYITGGFGYHIYCATACSVATKYTCGEGKVATEFAYTPEMLNKEVIIYLTRTAKGSESIQIDDTLLGLLENTELNDVFKDWYSDSYTYDGYFKDLVSKVRALVSADLSSIVEADNAKGDNYYITAKNNSGDKNPVLYAQKEYLFDLLTKYYNEMIAHYYTPIFDEINATTTGTGMEYVVLLKELCEGIASNSSFKLDGVDKNINLLETDDCKFPVLHLDDEDVVLSFAEQNTKASHDFLLWYTIDSIISEYKYVGSFVEAQVRIPE